MKEYTSLWVLYTGHRYPGGKMRVKGPRLGGWRLATGPIHVPQLQLIVNGHSSCPTDATHGDAIEIQEEGLSHGVASLLKHSA